MQPIDRPFRFTLDFCVVWALLAVPAYLLIRRADIGPWYFEIAASTLLALFAAFVLYGPVLLARQIIRSGSRGWLVARVLLSMVMFALLVYAGLRLSGWNPEASARLLIILSVFATTFLGWKLKSEPGAQPKNKANRSQSIGAETNRPSVTPDSHGSP